MSDTEPVTPEAPQDDPPVLDEPGMQVGETKQVEYDGKPVEIEYFGTYSVMTDLS